MAVQRRPKSKASEQDAQAFIAGGENSEPTSAPLPSSPKPKANKKPVALRFDGDLLERIDAAARSRGISRNAWISWQCAEGLKDE